MLHKQPYLCMPPRLSKSGPHTMPPNTRHTAVRAMTDVHSTPFATSALTTVLRKPTQKVHASRVPLAMLRLASLVRAVGRGRHCSYNALKAPVAFDAVEPVESLTEPFVGTKQPLVMPQRRRRSKYGFLSDYPGKRSCRPSLRAAVPQAAPFAFVRKQAAA